MADLTLLDIKKLDAGVGFDIIEENVALAPELRIIPAEVIRGTEVKLTVRTGLPTASFRNLNEGTTRSKSTYEDRVYQTAILDHQVAVDNQLLSGSLDPARVLTNHMSGAVEAAFRHAGSQFYYGTTNDAKGFPGLIAQMAADTDHEVDATGTTAKSSVFMLRIARETVQWIFGNGTTVNMASEWTPETVYDSGGKPYQANTNWLTGAIGCRVANKNAVVRVKNIGSAAGKILTDAHLFSALELFQTKMGADPTHIFMTARSLNQLRTGRTNTGSNEKGNPVPLPTDWMGIPIIRTASISNAETI